MNTAELLYSSLHLPSICLAARAVYDVPEVRQAAHSAEEEANAVIN